MKSKVYKIATYGGKSSGKTCILAALTLTRPENPSGFVCTWVAEKPESSVPGQSLPPDDRYLAGWYWIEMQRKRLRNGELPEANALDTVLKYSFIVSSPNEGMKTIELIDYSGELIHLSGDELKETLKKHMLECDGIMILADIPKEGDKTALAHELESLKQAFISILKEKIQGAKEDWPIAVILNKWDRLGKTAPASAEEAENEVRSFLTQTPRPPHSQLVDMLANVVPDGFMKSFAVSAFGVHDIGQSGKDVPRLKDGMLESYGLEDPLVWLVERADAMEVRQIAKVVKEKSNPWNPLQLFKGKTVQEAKVQPVGLIGLSTPKALESCATFCNRISDKSPNFKAIQAIKGILYTNSVRQIATAIFAPVFLILFSINSFCALSDGSTASENKLILTGKNKTATHEEIKNAENWALNYSHSSTWLRLFSHISVLSPSEAEELVSKSHEMRDEAAWVEVTSSSNEGDKIALAINYIASFQAGKHQEEAKGIVERGRGVTDDIINEAYLAALENKSQQQGLNFEEIDGIDRTSNTLPKSERPMTSKGQVLYEQIKKNLVARRMEEGRRIRDKEWEEFKSDVAKAIGSSLYSDAARMLVEKRTIKNYPSEEALASLENNVFRVAAERGIPEKVHDAIGRRQWDEARIHAKIFNEQNIQQLLKLSEAEATSRVNNLVTKVDDAQDEDIYVAIKKNGTESRRDCNKYLNLPFVGKRAKEVQAYLAYLNLLSNPIPVNLDLSKLDIDKEFYNWFGGLNGEIFVSINNVQLINNPPVFMPRGGLLANLGGGKIIQKVDERLNLKVEIRIRQGFIWNVNAPVIYTDISAKPVTVEELSKGFVLAIPGSSRPWTNTAHFQITGMPVEPKLP